MPNNNANQVQDVSRTYQYAQSVSTSQASDKFVTNNPLAKKRVLTEVKQALSTAVQFDSAVAFITKSGVISLFQALSDFVEKDGNARIVASDYLHFTQPAALEMLMKMQGVNVRLLQGAQYHGKLYLFNGAANAQVLVGSSNITQAALSKNDEINFLFSDGDERVNQARQQFERIWTNATPLNKHVLHTYSVKYESHKKKAIESQKLSRK